MRAGAHEVHQVSLDRVDEQEVAADMALAMVAPVAFEGMVQPFRGVSSNGTENLHKARLQASSMPVTLGSRSGRSSPRATMSGMVKA